MNSLHIATALRPMVRLPEPDETPLSDEEVVVLVFDCMERGSTTITVDLPRSHHIPRAHAHFAPESAS